MLIKTWFLASSCWLALLTFHPTAHASPEERSWQERQEQGLSASRLSVTTASLNVFLMPFGAAIWFSNAGAQTRTGVKRTSYWIGAMHAGAAVANVGWLVPAGASLHDYRRRTGHWMSVRRARTHVGFTAVDTGFRASGLVGGAVAVSRGNTGVGAALLATNAVVIPFHVWALYATIRELRHRKLESSLRASRVQPTPTGFRF